MGLSKALDSKYELFFEDYDYNNECIHICARVDLDASDLKELTQSCIDWCKHLNIPLSKKDKDESQ